MTDVLVTCPRCGGDGVHSVGRDGDSVDCELCEGGCAVTLAHAEEYLDSYSAAVEELGGEAYRLAIADFDPRDYDPPRPVRPADPALDAVPF